MPLLKQQQGVLSGGKLYKFLREAMGGWGAKMAEGTDYWLDLSPSFSVPLLSSWPPLSPSSFFSSLYNSVNISEWSSCGVHIRK